MNRFKFSGIIVITAIIMFGITACDEGGDKSESVEVTASNSGVIIIQYNGGDVMTVTITTGLPAPNNSFTLTYAGDTKTITGLSPGQKVKVTISFSGNYSNISVVDNAVFIQTYKN